MDADRTKPAPPPFAGRSTDSEFSLVVIAGVGEESRVFALDSSCPPRMFLGKAPGCDIRLSDPRISRRHAAIDLRGTHLEITDLDSRNGTYVNGVRVMLARLEGDEVVRVGDTSLKVTFVGADKGGPRSSAARFGRVVGASIEMRRLYVVLERLARAESPVLIEGEPGTGKDLVAESLHQESPLSGGPFVVLDAAAASHTGAVEEAFALARSGTVVLDELATFSFEAQSTLAKVLRARSAPGAPFVIATSCLDLEREVQGGRLREDVLQHFESGRLTLPPLRRRDGDVRFLALHLWSGLGGDPGAFPFPLLEGLTSYPWPGNVRELETVLAERLAGSDARVVTHSPMPGRSTDAFEETLALELPFPRARERILRTFEQTYLERALTKQNGNVLQAASASGVTRRYFQMLRARLHRG